jgi:anti-sigma factor RsiW
MNCRDSESLILAERDDVLTQEQHAALSDHVAACPACLQLRANLNTALDSLHAEVAAASVPDANNAWRELQAKLHKPARPRPLAPVIWFSAPLAAAAALAVAFFATRPVTPTAPEEIVIAQPLHDPSIIAGADFVEAGDPNATTLVYVDKESGWLVVWATDADAGSKG